MLVNSNSQSKNGSMHRNNLKIIKRLFIQSNHCIRKFLIPLIGANQLLEPHFYPNSAKKITFPSRETGNISLYPKESLYLFSSRYKDNVFKNKINFLINRENTGDWCFLALLHKERRAFLYSATPVSFTQIP